MYLAKQDHDQRSTELHLIRAAANVGKCFAKHEDSGSVFFVLCVFYCCYTFNLFLLLLLLVLLCLLLMLLLIVVSLISTVCILLAAHSAFHLELT